MENRWKSTVGASLLLVVFGTATACLPKLPTGFGDADPFGDSFTTRLDELGLTTADRQVVEAYHATGVGAWGHHSWDQPAQELTIDFDKSDYDCDGPTAGQKMSGYVSTLTVTTLGWDISGGRATWTNADVWTRSPTFWGGWKRTDGSVPSYLLMNQDNIAMWLGPMPNCP